MYSTKEKIDLLNSFHGKKEKGTTKMNWKSSYRTRQLVHLGLSPKPFKAVIFLNFPFMLFDKNIVNLYIFNQTKN